MQGPQVRRATIEDLPKLATLWQTEGLPAGALEKRFKEFQVVDGPDGSIVGAIGLQISGLEGHLHSEAFSRPELADQLRNIFWERIQVMAQNHGLVRVWTHLSAPFWHQSSFNPAPTELLSRVPSAFNPGPHPWLYVQLRDEPANVPSIEKEFAMFKELEHERTERILRQAKLMKVVAAVVVMGVFILIALFMFAWFKNQGRPPR
jgi:N-acetylglutamate synthase-like GNAT family acetyltransferase